MLEADISLRYTTEIQLFVLYELQKFYISMKTAELLYFNELMLKADISLSDTTEIQLFVLYKG